MAVQAGPVFENVQRDAEVDVLTFPAPLWHETGRRALHRHRLLGCDARSRLRLGQRRHLPRAMVHDRNHVALDMVPGKHGRIQYEKHKAAGKRFPVAIVLGGDPLGYLISGIEVPFGMCEYNYIGAILKQPVAVV